MSVYKYRLLKSSWGIAIDVTARRVAKFSTFVGLHQITSEIQIQIQQSHLTNREIGFILKGLELVALKISSNSIKYPVYIEIQNLHYNPTDYQEEGLAAAMIGWASQEFNFEEPDLPVYFNNNVNRYIFPKLNDTEQ